MQKQIWKPLPGNSNLDSESRTTDFLQKDSCHDQFKSIGLVSSMYFGIYKMQTWCFSFFIYFSIEFPTLLPDAKIQFESFMLQQDPPVNK